MSIDKRPAKLWYIEHHIIKSSRVYIVMEKYLIYIPFKMFTVRGRSVYVPPFVQAFLKKECICIKKLKNSQKRNESDDIWGRSENWVDEGVEVGLFTVPFWIC